jgi:hypothetical protein
VHSTKGSYFWALAKVTPRGERYKKSDSPYGLSFFVGTRRTYEKTAGINPPFEI